MYSRSLTIIVLATFTVFWFLRPDNVHATEAGPPQGYTLSDILTFALERHPTMSEAQGTIAQRQGQRVTAGSYLNPTISGAAGPGAIRDPSTGVRLPERTITLQQPLEWPAKRQARQDAAAAGLAGAYAALDETRMAVIADAKVAFYQLLVAQRDAELAYQNLATVEALRDIVKARVLSGESAQFEAIKANVQVQKAKKEVARAQNALVVARVTLDTRTAGALGKTFRVQGQFDPRVPPQDLDTLVTTALERNPMMRRYGKTVQQADLTVEQERQSRIPTVTVQGAYHREPGEEAFTAGLSVPVPLWYRRQGEIETALGSKRRAEAEWVRSRNELVRMITQHYQEMRTAQEQLSVFEKGLLKQAEEALDIARFSFQHGSASLLDVLDAQRDYRQTLLEYAQAQGDLAIAVARLERAVGDMP